MRKVHVTIAHALEILRELGYPAFAVFGEDDHIAAIVVAESEDALRITMAMPEKWEIGKGTS